jgi:hypothetical protein
VEENDFYKPKLCIKTLFEAAKKPKKKKSLIQKMLNM